MRSVSSGGVRLGKVRQVSSGEAWWGMARWNAVWFGGVRQVGWGEAMSVEVRIGVVRQVA